MPFALQKQATGLLGWLALKIGGRNPTGFGETVTPVIEVGDNYLLQGELDGELTLGTNVGIGSNSGQIAFAVPAGKLWRILALGCDLAIAAADNAFATDWYAFWTRGSGGSNYSYIVGSTTMPASAAGNARIGSLYLPRPFFAPPGSVITIGFRANANLTVAAANHATLLRQQFDL